jgi:hypothetical protein
MFRQATLQSCADGCSRLSTVVRTALKVLFPYRWLRSTITDVSIMGSNVAGRHATLKHDQRFCCLLSERSYRLLHSNIREVNSQNEAWDSTHSVATNSDNASLQLFLKKQWKEGHSPVCDRWQELLASKITDGVLLLQVTTVHLLSTYASIALTFDLAGVPEFLIAYSIKMTLRIRVE